jgi:para-nitrobenzyl esterase
MPSARGLLRRALAQSGASHHFHSCETATGVARSFLDQLGMSAAEAGRKLREVPPSKLLETQRQTMFRLGTSLGLLPFQPVVDGDSLPDSPLAAVRAGSAADVSLLTGTTRDEWKLFAFLDPDVFKLDEAGLVAKLAKRIPDVDAAELVAAYRRTRDGREPATPAALFLAIETDRVFRIPAIRLAEAQRPHQPHTFMYRFDWESPALGGVLGACHAIELPFVFGTYAREGYEMFAGHGPEADVLAARVMDAWIAFARSGEPQHPELPDWPPYEPQARSTMILGPECRLESDPGAADRRFWEGIL